MTFQVQGHFLQNLKVPRVKAFSFKLGPAIRRVVRMGGFSSKPGPTTREVPREVFFSKNGLATRRGVIQRMERVLLKI